MLWSPSLEGRRLVVVDLDCGSSHFGGVPSAMITSWFLCVFLLSWSFPTKDFAQPWQKLLCNLCMLSWTHNNVFPSPPWSGRPFCFSVCMNRPNRFASLAAFLWLRRFLAWNGRIRFHEAFGVSRGLVWMFSPLNALFTDFFQ